LALKKISEVAIFLNNKRVPLSSLEREKRKGVYPYYGASGIVDFIDDYAFEGTYLLISEDGENLRTRNTPIAFKASGQFWVNNHAHILDEKEDGILDYLEYYFSVLNLTPYLTGAVQPKLNKANLDSIEIPVPPKNERFSINKILNSLKHKIECNSRINQTLEQIAQAIFKSWFVDFDPVKAKIAALEAGGTQDAVELAAMSVISGKNEAQLAQLKIQDADAYQKLAQTAALFPAAIQESEHGEIPEGWMFGSLGDEIDFATGFTFKSNEFVESGIRLARGDNVKEGAFYWGDKTRYWPSVTKELQKYLLKSGDVLIGMDGSKVGKNWVRVTESDLPCLLVQRVARLRCSGSVGSSMLEILIGGKSFLNYVESIKTGTSIPHISGKQIKDLQIVIPSNKQKADSTAKCITV
jgi:type I restriction enzyme S subunit